MKAKVITGFLLALILGSCPCLMPLAAAHGDGSDPHSCCKGSDQKGTAENGAPADDDSSCCLRAPLPASVAIAAADLHVVGEAVSPVISFDAVRQERLRFDSAGLSPPGDPPPYGSNSPRAPPTLG